MLRKAGTRTQEPERRPQPRDVTAVAPIAKVIEEFDEEPMPSSKGAVSRPDGTSGVVCAVSASRNGHKTKRAERER